MKTYSARPVATQLVLGVYTLVHCCNVPPLLRWLLPHGNAKTLRHCQIRSPHTNGLGTDLHCDIMSIVRCFCDFPAIVLYVMYMMLKSPPPLIHIIQLRPCHNTAITTPCTILLRPCHVMPPRQSRQREAVTSASHRRPSLLANISHHRLNTAIECHDHKLISRSTYYTQTRLLPAVFRVFSSGCVCCECCLRYT